MPTRGASPCPVPTLSVQGGSDASTQCSNTTLAQACSTLAVGSSVAFSGGAQSAFSEADLAWQTAFYHDDAHGFVHLMGKPANELDLISPYFVPGKEGAATLAALAKGGVRVRILTNSLAASDESAVHAGYAKHRLGLLKAGVELYELKPTATKDVKPEKSGFGSGSSAALHAKTFAVDRQRWRRGPHVARPQHPGRHRRLQQGPHRQGDPLSREAPARQPHHCAAARVALCPTT